MDSWEKFLNPKELRQSLINASLYIAAYESCKESVVGKLQSFYSDYWDKDGAHPGPEYEQNVMSLSKSPLHASLLWFNANGAIDEADILQMSQARELRNRVVHDLPYFLSEPDRQIDTETFENLLSVTHKIGVWWAVNVEIATDPDYSGETIDEEGIQTGTIMIIQLMMDIANGNEPEEGHYLSAIRQMRDDA